MNMYNPFYILNVFDKHVQFHVCILYIVCWRIYYLETSLYLAPAVVQLTVSLGDSKTLQLPDDDKVSLVAFVLPATPPRGQAYTYEYHIVMKPPEGSNVQMSSAGQEHPEVEFSHVSTFHPDTWNSL